MLGHRLVVQPVEDHAVGELIQLLTVTGDDQAAVAQVDLVEPTRMRAAGGSQKMVAVFSSPEPAAAGR